MSPLAKMINTYSFALLPLFICSPPLAFCLSFTALKMTGTEQKVTLKGHVQNDVSKVQLQISQEGENPYSAFRSIL